MRWQRRGPAHLAVGEAHGRPFKIRFRKPGKNTLFVDFKLDRAEMDEIKRLAETERSVDRVYNIELKDKDGVVHAIVEKTLCISKKV